MRPLARGRTQAGGLPSEPGGKRRLVGSLPSSNPARAYQSTAELAPYPKEVSSSRGLRRGGHRPPRSPSMSGLAGSSSGRRTSSGCDAGPTDQRPAEDNTRRCGEMRGNELLL